MKKSLKKLLSILLIICLTFQMTGNIQQVKADNIPKYYGWGETDKDLGDTGCFIYAFSMLLTNFGFNNAKPSDIFAYNNNSNYLVYSNIERPYSITIDQTSLSGNDITAKINFISNMLNAHPEGVVVTSPAPSHAIFAFLYNGTVRFHDPYSVYKKNVDHNKLQYSLNAFNTIRYISNGTTPPQPTPPAPVTPSFTFENHGVGGSRGWVTETNASVYGIIHTNITSGLECGLKIGTASNTYSKIHPEAVSSAGYNQIANNGYMEIWYDVNTELGVTLTPGTTYYYRFFMKYNGQEYTGPEGTFKTSGPTPAPTPPAPSFTFENHGVGGSRGWVTETNASVYGVIHTNITSGLECGLKIGSSSNTYFKTHTEAVSSAGYNQIANNGYTEIWYDVNTELGVTLTPGTTYYYRFFMKYNGQEYAGPEGTFKTKGTTPAPTPPAPTFTFENHGVGGSRGWVTETNASVYGIIHTNITSGLECGLKIGTASNTYSKIHPEAVSSAGYNQITNNGYMEIWYDVNQELGVTLTPGTTYYYRFFMKYNGQEYTGPEGTFKTIGTTPAPTPPAPSFTFENHGVGDSHGWVTETNASVYGVIHTNMTSGLECGLKIGSSSNTYFKTHTEAVSSAGYNQITNNGYMEIWYDVNTELGVTLTPGTTYYYRFFMKYNGQEYAGPEGTFKTTGTAPYFNFENKGVTGTYGWVEDTNASVYALIHTNVTSGLECGISLGQASGQYTKTFTEVLSNAGYNQIKANGYFEAWYNIKDELGMTLTPDTTYYYKFFVKHNGVTHFGNEGSFKTASAGDSGKFNFENIGVTGNRGWATSGNASVYALIHTNISSGLECGIRVGQASKQYTKSFIENVSYAGYSQIQNKGYVEAWYNLKDELGMTLSPGATYYYQFFVKYNNNTYYGKEGSFTTPAASDSVVGADNIQNGDVTNDTIPESLWIAGVANQTYNGQNIQQNFRVYDYKTLLRENIDYSVTYKNNKNVNLTYDAQKDAAIIVTGKGNYSGQATVFYNIAPKDISSNDIFVENIIATSNNKTQRPVPKVTYKGKTLKNNKDFTVSYPTYGDYKSSGTYEILIIGKGNFSGSRTVQFNITDNPLIKKASVSKIPNQAYSGAKITPSFTVKLGKTILTEGIDYSVTYKNNTNIGTATAIITALPNSGLAGSKEIEFKIVGASISKAKISGFKPTFSFTGKNMAQSCTLTYTDSNKGTITLLENKDYTISYSKNQQAGTASITFTGINAFYGTLTKKFKISAYDINKDIDNLITAEVSNTVYAKGGSKPKPIVKFGNSILTEGTDYTLSYKNNKIVNNTNKLPTVIIKGKKNFKGSISLNYGITSQDLGNLSILVSDAVYKDKAANFELSDVTIYDKNGNKLKKNTDYYSEFIYTYGADITLDNGTICQKGAEVDNSLTLPAGSLISVSVIGKNNYTGVITGTYQIVYASISTAKVKIPEQEYTGYEITPGKDEITVKLGNTLLSSNDFDIIGISKNIEKGTATITLKGKGNYGGIKTATFKIKTKSLKWW